MLRVVWPVKTNNEIALYCADENDSIDVWSDIER